MGSHTVRLGCESRKKSVPLHYKVTEGASASSILFAQTSISEMIDKTIIEQIVSDALSGTDKYLVDVTITPTNEITVEIDSDTAVDIDTCAAITRAIEQGVDRDVEDYELEVGSAGLTAPLKIRRQYEKNIGNDVEVLTGDGRKLQGTLTAVSDDFATFTITTRQKVKQPDKKRPVMVDTPVTIAVADAKYVKYLINFK